MINLLVFIAVVAVIVILAKSVVLKPRRSATADTTPEQEAPAQSPEQPPESPSATQSRQQPAQHAEPLEPSAKPQAEPRPEQPKPAQSKPEPAKPVTTEPQAATIDDSELANVSDPVARHRIFQQRVEDAYRERATEQGRLKLMQYAAQHLAEFDDIAPALQASNGGQLPQVHTFKYYATALSEQGQYEQAIAVCEQALAYGLKDGTKSGYQGRLERIQAKQNKTSP